MVYLANDLLSDANQMSFGNAAKRIIDGFTSKYSGTGNSDDASSSDASSLDTSMPASPPVASQQPVSTVSQMDAASSPMPTTSQQVAMSSTIPQTSQRQADTSADTSVQAAPPSAGGSSWLPSMEDLAGAWGYKAPADSGSSSNGGSTAAGTTSSTSSTSSSSDQQPTKKAGSWLPSLEDLAGSWGYKAPSKNDSSSTADAGTTSGGATRLNALMPSGTPDSMPSATDRTSPQLANGQRADISYGSGAPGPAGPIVGGNRDDFLRTATPYAQQVEKETGIPAKLTLAVAGNETGWGDPQYVIGNNYHGIHAVGDQPAIQSTDHDAEGRPYTVGYRKFDSPAEGFRGFADFLTQNKRYAPALAAYKQSGDVNQLIADVAGAGYAEDPQYAGKIQAIMADLPDTPPPSATASVTLEQAPKPSATTGIADGPNWRKTWGNDLTPDQIKSTLAEGMDWDSAIATCGIAASVAFARANGGNPPTFGQALRLAQGSGEWNSGVGMTHGSAGEVALLKKMGVDAHAEGINEQKIAQTVQSGAPVQINAQGGGGHFYVAQDYDPQTGRFNFGNSASILTRAGGRTWFRLDELSALGVGTPSEAIYLGAGQ